MVAGDSSQNSYTTFSVFSTWDLKLGNILCAKGLYFDFLFRLGHENLIEILLKSGANINAQDLDKRTPLHLAAKEGEPFLKWNCASNSNSVSIVTFTLTHSLCANNFHILNFLFCLDHENVVDILLRNGANNNALNMNNRTPLQFVYSIW